MDARLMWKHRFASQQIKGTLDKLLYELYILKKRESVRSDLYEKLDTIHVE